VSWLLLSGFAANSKTFRGALPKPRALAGRFFVSCVRVVQRSCLMNQRELEAEVAGRTGESLKTIRRRGFNLVHPNEVQEDFEVPRDPLVVDWDALDARRRAA
jgi:hypothetical protein